MDKYEVKEEVIKMQDGVNDVKKINRKVKRWARENKDELTVAGILVGTAIVGGVIGYRIHVGKVNKGVDKTLKVIRESEAVYTQVYDKATRETTHIISMTVDRFGKMVKELEGAVK